MPQVEVKVADPQSGETVPIGTVGEILTRGSCVTKGYFDNEEATRQALTDDGWLRTGDLGSMASDGYLTIQGRMKEMIIRGGENVYPREIEEVLLSHPAVARAYVVGLPDAEWGEIIAAFIQLRAGNAEAESELTSFCRVRLASYKTPRVWRFVDGFPETASGKVQKYVLREQFLKELRAEKSPDGTP
jgi:fatty-acyl-CoA synthase